ncbi:MAG: hypothetical protein OXN21_02760 [Chloroflexota bacterium]|nr:hypothetical protein [Chloroflexota bacterium]
MQEQPLEARLASVESGAERHEQILARLASIAEDHDQLLDRLVANQETLQANQEAIVGLLEELTRDAATTRRLWLRLAQRYGWMDDEQNGAQPETPA